MLFGKYTITGHFLPVSTLLISSLPIIRLFSLNSSKEIPKSSTTEKNTDNQQIVTQPQETKEDIKPNENKQE